MVVGHGSRANAHLYGDCYTGLAPTARLYGRVGDSLLRCYRHRVGWSLRQIEKRGQNQQVDQTRSEPSASETVIYYER